MTTLSTDKLKAADVLAAFLAEKKIRHVFGIVGAGNAHLFDAIDRLGFTEIVCVHHEQAAVMAMGTYYRIHGTCSAALLTTGAGSTNGVTGVVSCWMDSVPGIIIAGNENSKYTRPDNPLRIWGVQGYDSVAMVEKVVKYAKRVMQPEDIWQEMSRAHDIALTGRPGPVWLEIPMNVQSSPTSMATQKTYQAPSKALPPETLQEDVASILAELTAAQRPVLWLGHGIRLAGGQRLIEPLLQALQRPALVSWAGIDMVESDHPLVFGRAGVYGQRHANFVLQNADYVLAIGTRLAVPQVGYDVQELAREARFAVVDIEAAEARKLGRTNTRSICADAKHFIDELLRQVAAAPIPPRAPWLQQCRAYKDDFPIPGPEHADQDGFINSYRFMDRLSGLLKERQIVTTDMGTALLSGHQVLRLTKGQRLLTSTGLGEMGFGLPAAIGASIATDRGEVLCLNCDGGMMMNLQELQTIAHHRLPIKIVVFNNDGYLMIKHTQKALFKGRYAGTDKKSGVSCPDYSKLAHAFDFASYQVRSWDDFESQLPLFLSGDGPAICEVFMHPEQLFVPKLSLAVQKDGSLISPPLEDLSPFISRDALKRAMLVGVHDKSRAIEPESEAPREDSSALN